MILVSTKRAQRRQLLFSIIGLLAIIPGSPKANYVFNNEQVDCLSLQAGSALYGNTSNEDTLAGDFTSSISFQYAQKQVKELTSIAGLKAALKTAIPGDVLLLADGQYDIAQDIEITARGKAGAPIIISAAHSGKVILTGEGGITLKDPATYIEIRDFVFRHASSRAKSGVGTSHCRWTHNVFETTGKGEDLTIAGDNQEVDHNNFLNKDAMGRFLAIRGQGSQIAQHLWIHHNYFAHFKDQGGKNGAEAFQFGLSGYSMSTSNSLVEHNLFEDCNGEAELISVKSSGVTLRYNTFRDSKAQFTLRHGNHCAVYGNYFFNTPGIRFFGDDHVIYSNYFENCRLAIQIGNGDGEVADGAKLTCHDRPDRIFVGFNTLVNNKTGIVFDARKEGLGATAIQITGNLILGSGVVAKIEQGGGVLLRPVWTDNVYYGDGNPGDLPLGSNGATQLGNRKENPGLIRINRKGLEVSSDHVNTGATLHLSKQSPKLLIQNKVPVLFKSGKATDIDGQPRKGQLNIGADQISDAPVINFALQQPAIDSVGITE